MPCESLWPCLRSESTGLSVPLSRPWTLELLLHISMVTAHGGNLTDWEKSHGNEEKSDQEIAQGKANRANQIANNQNEVARWTAGG